MVTLPVAFILPAVFALTVGAVGFVYWFLLRQQLVSGPKGHQIHTRAIPVGAGLGFIPVLAGGLTLLTPTSYFLWGPLLILMGLSWWNDRKDISILWRLLAHMVGVGLALWVLPLPAVFGEYLPPGVEMVLLYFLWVTFINVYNFMDGADGLTATETISICGGVCAILLWRGEGAELVLFNLIIIAGMFGYLVFNYPPAKIFMGDTGSISLGFLMGYNLIQMGGLGYIQIPIILSLYYSLDVGLTMLQRLREGHPIWRARPDYFFQRAILRGLSHGQVVGRVALLNGGLVGFCFLSFFVPTWVSLGGALLTGGLFMKYGWR